jgi:hypothetical protein
MLGSKTLSHLSQHCCLVRPGNSATITGQFLPPCVFTESFSLMSSSSAHLPVRLVTWSILGSKTSFHLSRHCCLVRSGTSAAIATQFSPLCVCTASFSLMSSYSDHVPVRLFDRSILGSKTSFHLSRHCCLLRSGTSAAIATQFLLPSVSTASFNFLSPSDVHLPPRAVAGSMLETKAS